MSAAATMLRILASYSLLTTSQVQHNLIGNW